MNPDIDDMTDRTVLVTGATDGLGRALAVRLGAAGARLILHGRNPERAAAVAADVVAAGGATPQIILADLSQLREVDRLADEIIARTSHLDVLVNNAGISGRTDGRRELTADGTSAGQQEIDLEDPTPERDCDAFAAYCRAKLATIEYAEELHGTGVTVNALHPGYSKSATRQLIRS